MAKNVNTVIFPISVVVLDTSLQFILQHISLKPLPQVILKSEATLRARHAPGYSRWSEGRQW